MDDNKDETSHEATDKNVLDVSGYKFGLDSVTPNLVESASPNVVTPEPLASTESKINGTELPQTSANQRAAVVAKTAESQRAIVSPETNEIQSAGVSPGNARDQWASKLAATPVDKPSHGSPPAKKTHEKLNANNEFNYEWKALPEHGYDNNLAGGLNADSAKLLAEMKAEHQLQLAHTTHVSHIDTDRGVRIGRAIAQSGVVFLVFFGFVGITIAWNANNMGGRRNAVDAFKRGEYSKAIELYEKEVESWPSSKQVNLRAHENMALARAQLGNYDQSISELAVAIDSRLKACISRKSKNSSWSHLGTDLANYFEIARMSGRQGEIRKMQSQVWNAITKNSKSDITRTGNEYKLLLATADSLAWRGYGPDADEIYKRLKEIGKLPFPQRDAQYRKLEHVTLPKSAPGLRLDVHYAQGSD